MHFAFAPFRPAEPGADSPDECAEHAASIEEIPVDQFSDQEARAELIRRAMCGCDVYAYRPAFQPEYVVWVRQQRPDIEARFAPMEWARQWRAGEQPIWPAQRPEAARAEEQEEV